MRFRNTGMFTTSYILRNKEFRNILMTNLGLTSTDVDEFLDVRKNVLNLPHYRLIKNCLICQKYNVDLKPLDSLHYCLRLLDYKLEHRINVLKDMGVPVINVSLINRMIYHFSTTVSKFKEKANIPDQNNITENIFGDEIPDDISELELNDKLTVRQYYEACLLYYKNRVFNLPYLDDKILLRSFMRIKSISMIEETLKVLRNDLHYDEEMIRKNPSAIIASADNIRSLLSFTDILGIPIVTCLRKYPHMLFQDTGNIKRLLTSFKQYEIPDKYVKNHMKIFMLSNEVFRERMEILKHHSDLSVWYKHPRTLQIISQIRKAKYRVGYVDVMGSLNWAHPQAFLSSKTLVDNSVREGVIPSSKHNLKHVLVKELGVDESDLLMRHQNWKQAAFVHIAQMLKYLKKHFTIDEIRPNIHIVLHKQAEVQKTLADLKRQYSQSTEYSFTNSQYLALCLYTLEKADGFRGDGVLSNQQNSKQQSLEKRDAVERSDNDTSILRNTYDNLNTEDSDNIDHNIHDRNTAFSNNTCNINS